jgi:hypothetical protein
MVHLRDKPGLTRFPPEESVTIEVSDLRRVRQFSVAVLKSDEPPDLDTLLCLLVAARI